MELQTLGRNQMTSWQQKSNHIKMEAMFLGEGENTRSIECPFCPPHDKEPNSFSVTRSDEGLLFNCYRAKCKQSGFIPSIPITVTDRPDKKNKVNSFTYEVSKLSNEQYRRLILNYNLTVDEIDSNEIQWVSETRRLAIPLFDKNYLRWGWEAKIIKGLEPPWIKGKGTTKSIVYPTQESYTRLYYPKLSKEYVKERSSMNEDTIVLVEDVFSAIRVMRYRDSAALLGCNLDLVQVLELMDGYKNIILALDADATQKAIKIAKEYSGYFEHFEVKQLNKDPKDMSENELEREFLLV